MRNPHIAADGYTYEAEVIKGWLHSGRSTSPVTKLPRAHHHLIPNHALSFCHTGTFQAAAAAEATIVIGSFYFRELAGVWLINALREEKMRQTKKDRHNWSIQPEFCYHYDLIIYR